MRRSALHTTGRPLGGNLVAGPGSYMEGRANPYILCFPFPSVRAANSHGVARPCAIKGLSGKCSGIWNILAS